MNKTLLLQGMTVGAAAGNAGTLAPIDITERVLGVFPTLETPTTTSQFFSTIVTDLVEGKAKYLLNRKTHINRYNTTAAIHEAGSVGDASIGDVTTAKFKQSNKEVFEFILNKSWDAGFIYDKKKDPKVREGQLINDMGSVMEDKREEQAKDFYEAINKEIGLFATSKSASYDTYVSSEDGLTKDSPTLNQIVSIASSPANLDEAKLDAIKIVDAMFRDVEEQAKMGRKGSSTSGFPYYRGTRGALGSKFVVKSDLIPVISLDERFVQAGLSPEMIRRGVVGLINNVEVIQDDMMDTVSNHDWILMGTGQYSPVLVVTELADAIQVFDHPTKPTRAELTEASGGWDTHVPPHINLVRTGIVNAS